MIEETQRSLATEENLADFVLSQDENRILRFVWKWHREKPFVSLIMRLSIYKDRAYICQPVTLDTGETFCEFDNAAKHAQPKHD